MDGQKNSLRSHVRNQILEFISTMDLTHNTRLLSESQLAAKFQVSRSTIRTVLSDLEVEGKVLRKQGSGTYVNLRAIQLDTLLYPRADLRGIIIQNGYTAKNELLSIRKVSAGRLAHTFNCSQTNCLQEIRTLYYADETPCMYCIDYIQDGRVTDAQWKSPTIATQSLYDFLRQAANINIKWDLMRIQATTSGEVPELATHFDIPIGKVKSFVLLEIANYDEQNLPVIYGMIYVDADRIKLNLVRDLGPLS